MLQTDMRVMLVYEHDPPLPPGNKEGAGALDLILYYADGFGDFFRSDLLQSLLPIMRKDCLIVLVNYKEQTKIT